MILCYMHVCVRVCVCIYLYQCVYMYIYKMGPPSYKYTYNLCMWFYKLTWPRVTYIITVVTHVEVTSNLGSYNLCYKFCVLKIDGTYVSYVLNVQFGIALTRFVLMIDFDPSYPFDDFCLFVQTALTESPWSADKKGVSMQREFGWERDGKRKRVSVFLKNIRNTWERICVFKLS